MSPYRFFRQILKAGRKLTSLGRLLVLWGQYGRRGLPSDLAVNPRVRVSVTDGGQLSLASGCVLDRDTTLIVKAGQLHMGARSYVGIGSLICARERVKIGEDCLIAERVSIRDQDHRVTPGEITAHNGFDTAPILIGNNVWIGAGAVITKGVSIGDNAVIGAGAVVTRDIPAGTTAVGMPARARGQSDS